MVKKPEVNQITEYNLTKPSEEQTYQHVAATKSAIEKLAQKKIQALYQGNNFKAPESKMIRYTPNQTGLFNNELSGKQRIIKITERPIDPLENVKFKHKKIPRGQVNEPEPVMHSPQRKITAQDQRDWKVPPCIPNSKNPKGLVIPLDIRLAADGRNLKEYTANSNFSKFADVLFIAEKTARSEIEERNRIQESIQMQATMKKEEELKLAAKQARMEKAAMSVSNISSVNTTKTDDTMNILLGKRRNRSLIEKEKNERDELRNLRKKEIEYNRKIELSMKSNKKRNDRDISEKIALGQAQPSGPIIDSRLYSHVSGLDAGFKDDGDNDLYDKPLFADRSSANIYKTFRGEDSEKIDSKKLMEKIYAKGKMFEGADPSNMTERSGPVQFEKEKK